MSEYFFSLHTIVAMNVDWTEADSLPYSLLLLRLANESNA